MVLFLVFPTEQKTRLTVNANTLRISSSQGRQLTSVLLFNRMFPLSRDRKTEKNESIIIKTRLVNDVLCHDDDFNQSHAMPLEVSATG